MKLDVFREEMERFRQEVDQEARELKDSYRALERLFALYETFDSHERDLADQVMSEWVLSEDESTRFDAMALIRKFGIRRPVSALRQLGERLADAAEPSAPFEREKVEILIAEIETK